MTDSILVIGSGLAGLTAAMRCVDAGAKAVLVENDAIVGGRLSAAMTSKSSAGAAIDGVPIPKLTAIADNPGIEVFTLSTLESIEGTPGNFDITISEKARFVTDACTRCNNCKPVCPEVLPNEYEAGLSYRKAIFTPHVEAFPEAFAIDIDACLNTPPNYLPCNRCIEVCDDNAIHFDMPLEQTHDRKVGAVIIGAGDEVVPIEDSGAFGYGDHPDVVTADELECLLTAPGPTGGFVARPSNEEYPDSMLVLLDELTEVPVHTTIDHVSRLVEQNIGRIVLLVTVKPDEDEKAALLTALPAGIDTRFGLLQKIEGTEGNVLRVTYVDFDTNEVPEELYDMVVLGSETRPPAGLDRLAEVTGVELAASGYVAVGDQCCATSQPGIYVAGCAAGPAIISRTFEQATTAASAALSHLDPRLLSIQPSIEDAEPGAAGPSEEQLRARIEQALHAMLNSGD